MQYITLLLYQMSQIFQVPANLFSAQQPFNMFIAEFCITACICSMYINMNKSSSMLL